MLDTGFRSVPRHFAAHSRRWSVTRCPRRVCRRQRVRHERLHGLAVGGARSVCAGFSGHDWEAVLSEDRMLRNSRFSVKIDKKRSFLYPPVRLTTRNPGSGDLTSRKWSIWYDPQCGRWPAEGVGRWTIGRCRKRAGRAMPACGEPSWIIPNRARSTASIDATVQPRPGSLLCYRALVGIPDRTLGWLAMPNQRPGAGATLGGVRRAPVIMCDMSPVRSARAGPATFGITLVSAIVRM